MPGEAYELLADLVDRLKAEPGLHPKEHPDCQWGEDYPHEYYTALDYVQDGDRDDQKAISRLSSLLYKIDSEAKRGTPLCSQNRSWCDDGLPPEISRCESLCDRADGQVRAGAIGSLRKNCNGTGGSVRHWRSARCHQLKVKTDKERHPEYSQFLREICRKLAIRPFDMLRAEAARFLRPYDVTLSHHLLQPELRVRCETTRETA
jgi:hypothetical protein